MKTHEEVKKFIKNLKYRKTIELAVPIYTDFQDWVFYYSVSGWFKGNYFQLYIMKSKPASPIIIEVPDVTDEIESFKKAFKL